MSFKKLHDRLNTSMEPIVVFYDNAFIYSPNVSFIFLFLFFSFILLLIGSVFFLFVDSIRYTAEYVIEIQKERKKITRNRVELLLKAVFVTYMIFNRKKERIFFYIKKVIDAIKKEVLVKEGEQI